MAGDWIKFETATLDKAEVWAIATELGIDPDAVVGKLLRVWAWFDAHSENGNAPSVTSALLDRKCGVTGFVTAMINCGWMEERDQVLSLPNFTRHNGQTAKSRALTAKRVASNRKCNANRNARSVTGALPREEKRREEYTLSRTQTEKQESGLLADPDFRAQWELWQHHRLEKGKPLGQIEAEAQLMDLARGDASEAADKVRYSIERGAMNLITNGDHKRQSKAAGAAKQDKRGLAW